MSQRHPLPTSPDRNDTARPAQDGGLLGLFDAHRAELLRFLRARSGDAGMADDLLQELWIKLPTPSPAGGPSANGRAYLFRMANNLVLDTARARQRAMARDHAWLNTLDRAQMPPEASADPSPNAEEALHIAEEARQLADAIAALPPAAARALRLHRLDGHSQADVARIMGISRSGVEKHLATALRHLRRILLAPGDLDCGSVRGVASGESRDLAGEPDPTEPKP